MIREIYFFNLEIIPIFQFPSLMNSPVRSSGCQRRRYPFCSHTQQRISGSSRTLNRSGWYIAGVISRRYLAQSTQKLATILLLVLLIIAFSALYISLLISQSVYRPIQTLCTMMEAVEAGDFSVRYSEPPADELGRLGNNLTTC